MAIDLLYIVSTLQRSGPTNQLYYLLKHLDNEFNATVLTLSPEPDDSELPRFRDLGIKYETLGLSRTEGLLLGPKQLRSFVSNSDPDIVHTQGIRADTLSAALLSDYPRITTIRNYPYDDYPAKFGKLQGTAMAWEHLRVFNRMDYPIACSETIAEIVEPHGIKAKPIQNGVDHYEYTPVSESRQRELRQKLGLPEEDDIIISVGSLIPRKDPETVINGYIASDLTDTMLIFLGDGPLKSSCEEVARGDDSIQFEGWVDNVDEYLQAADYFVSASKSEGLPNAVMEALAVGLPVCLSNIEPHQEILGDQKIGEYFPVEDPHELANRLCKITRLEYQSISQQARDIASTKLSAERMSEEYKEAYLSLCT